MTAFCLLFTLMSDLTASEPELLKALYTATPGSNPEYAQGAIERNELPHREITTFVWLIRVPDPGSPAEWERRLNDAVASEHGSFRVVEASPEEKRQVASGEITLQQ
jgi:hypothetical protein